MNYDGVPTPIVSSDSTQVPVEFCDNADLPVYLRDYDRNREKDPILWKEIICVYLRKLKCRCDIE